MNGALPATSTLKLAGFFLNAVKVEEIVHVAKDHQVMPQKSTFFYPKVYSGLVTQRLE